MFAEFPKLFGKSFAIGFLAPTAAIATAVWLLFWAHAASVDLLGVAKTDILGLGAISLVVLWIFAIALMGISRGLIRLLEGYGKLNPFTVIEHFELDRFDALHESVEKSGTVLRNAAAALEAHRRAMRRRHPPAGAAATLATLEREFREAETAYGKHLLEFSEQFPNRRKHVLPTRFGNTVRAFEVYSGVVYGLDSIPGWPRLLSVLPKDYREQIGDAEAMVSFWVNLWFGGTVVGLADILWTIIGRNQSFPWIWIPAFIAAVGAANLARGSARQWGEYVKSGFDLYRGELAKQLGLKLPTTIEAERQMWTLFSQTTIYRTPDTATKLDPYLNRTS